MNEILTALLSDGYPIETIARETGIRISTLRNGDLNAADENRLLEYASKQPCCRELMDED